MSALYSDYIKFRSEGNSPRNAMCQAKTAWRQKNDAQAAHLCRVVNEERPRTRKHLCDRTIGLLPVQVYVKLEEDEATDLFEAGELTFVHASEDSTARACHAVSHDTIYSRVFGAWVTVSDGVTWKPSGMSRGVWSQEQRDQKRCFLRAIEHATENTIVMCVEVEVLDMVVVQEWTGGMTLPLDVSEIEERIEEAVAQAQQKIEKLATALAQAEDHTKPYPVRGSLAHLSQPKQ